MSRIILCEEVGDPRAQKSRCRVIDMSRAGCDPRCGQYVGPDGYVNHAEWAEDMLRTHEQRQCPGCERWTIWLPLPDEPERGGAT